MALNICIASPDVMGPIRNGGVGTACTALAQELALAGYQVTLFYTLDVFETGSEEVWRAFYDRFGIEFVSLPPAPKPPPHIGPTVYEGDSVEKSYRVYEYLKQRHFDVIHFPDYMGHGYFSALARRQGIAFENTRIWVTCHSPTLWSRVGNLAPCDDIAFHVRDRLERGVVEHCDLLLSPSQYMLDWLREHGWTLPDQTRVIPNLLPSNGPVRMAVDEEQLAPTWKGIPRELVFFGRLETRKGLQIFCDAINRLVEWLPDDLEITFLGKSSPQLGSQWLGTRVKNWPFGWRIIDDFDSFQATDYLRGPGRLAVMPSLCDNSPYSVLECLALGIPFIAADVGGVSELIAAEDRAWVLSEPDPIGLAEAIARVFRSGTVAARQAHTRDSVRRSHRELYAGCTGGEQGPGARQVASEDMPLVSVCILHKDRGPDLAQAIASIRAQTYTNVEIVVVDNGSTCQMAVEYLEQLAREDCTERLQVLRLPQNVYEPKARNTAAEAAQGEFLLFMDDDNRAKPHEVECFVRAAQCTGADIYTCFADHFATNDVPDSDEDVLKRFIVIGDAGPVGLIFNAYGDLNFLVRRDRFMDVGGFVEDQRFNHAEDWRFLARAHLNGLRISVVPEALFWYKSHAGAVGRDFRKRDRSGALYRVASSADANLASDGTFLLLAQGLFWRAADNQRELEALRAQLRDVKRDLASAHSTIAQQRRKNEHARETVEALSHGFQQIVETCGPDPVTDAIWNAARHRLFPYVDTSGRKTVRKLSQRGESDAV